LKIGFWEAHGWSEPVATHACSIKDGRWMDRKHFSIGFGFDFAYLQGMAYIIFLRIVPMFGEQHMIIVKNYHVRVNKC
jgi:hypothetical protein